MLYLTIYILLAVIAVACCSEMCLLVSSHNILILNIKLLIYFLEYLQQAGQWCSVVIVKFLPDLINMFTKVKSHSSLITTPKWGMVKVTTVANHL